jgi:hypothetical protein
VCTNDAHQDGTGLRGVKMENESTHGLRLDQLAGLLSLGLEDPDPADAEGQDNRMADLLREQLSCALPRSMLLFDALVMMMGRLGCDVRSLAGRSLREVLRNPESDIGLLQAIKDCRMVQILSERKYRHRLGLRHGRTKALACH